MAQAAARCTCVRRGRTALEPAAAARERIGTWLEERGCGRIRVYYRLRDWCISRQRYWGPPIPIIHCPDCGPVAVPEADLPVRLPLLEDFAPDGSGRSPLARCADFVAAECPQCGRAGQRETDVSDNFLDSAWYFLRYPSTGCEAEPFAPSATAKWLPVDMYIGGQEHAVLHLLYTRFLTRALRDLGLIDFAEPFKRFRNHGIIVKDGAKMSKSKGNVVNPDEYLQQYGADVFRTYLMFMGPFQEGGDFRAGGINGIRRFLERVWRWVDKADWRDGPIAERAVEALLHRQIRKIGEEMEALRYNTAIAGAMELFNGLQEAPPYRQSGLALVQLLAPFAPYTAQEMWTRLGGEGWVGDAPWPRSDETLARRERGDRPTGQRPGAGPLGRFSGREPSGGGAPSSGSAAFAHLAGKGTSAANRLCAGPPVKRGLGLERHGIEVERVECAGRSASFSRLRRWYGVEIGMCRRPRNTPLVDQSRSWVHTRSERQFVSSGKTSSATPSTNQSCACMKAGRSGATTTIWRALSRA